MKKLLFLSSLVVLLSCDSKSELENEIAAIPVSVDLVRFDKIFGKAKPEDLPDLKQSYPQFFPEQYADSVWYQRMQDTLQMQLTQEVSRVFPSEDFLEDELQPLFQHIKYYFPAFREPRIYTTTSDVDYKNKVIFSDTELVIGLDNYLGSDHEFYQSIPKYITANLKRERIASDVAAAYSRKLIAVPRQRTLLAQMVYFGKELYLKDLWLPEAPDELKIGYSTGQIQWVYENEVDIWRYFVENEMLYSTDAKLPNRFINPAPFSKFYLEIDNESPGRIGRYIGWQIVRSFMDNNDFTPSELMRIEPETIFKDAKYKPRK